MPLTAYFSSFLVGLFGGVHCMVMCGGFVAAVSLDRPRKVHVLGRAGRWRLQARVHVLRLGSYVVAGALLGGLGGALAGTGAWAPASVAVFVAANLLLIAIGLALAAPRLQLRVVERAGAALGAPALRALAGIVGRRGTERAWMLAAGWALVPCGLLYGVYALALVSGGALEGALLMLAFGAGTLPNLLLAGAVLPRLRERLSAPAAKWAAAALLVGFGALGLARAAGIAPGWSHALFCLPKG